jgi:hypothetical protein
VLRLARALESAPDDATLRGVIGMAAAARGDRRTADSIVALLSAEERDDGSRGAARWARARIAATLGDRAAATDLLRDAFARGAPWAARLDLHRDPAFESLRGHPPFEELRRPRG